VEQTAGSRSLARGGTPAWLFRQKTPNNQRMHPTSATDGKPSYLAGG